MLDMVVELEKFSPLCGQELYQKYLNCEYVDSIQLNERHNPGDIIDYKNSKWIIMNDCMYSQDNNYPFKKGYWVKIIDLQYIEYFSTTQEDLDKAYNFLQKISIHYDIVGRKTTYRVAYNLLYKKSLEMKNI